MSKRTESEIIAEVEKLQTLNKDDLRLRWSTLFGKTPPPALTKDLLGCARPTPGSPSRVAVLAPRKILRSSELPSSSSPIIASLMSIRSCDAYTARK
jgi:hypothetical protein